MKIPYSTFELKIALLGITLDEEKLKKFEKEHLNEIFPANQATLNKKVAEDNGISIDTLIQSPNYGLLREQYMEGVTLEAIEAIKEEFVVDTKQAWAVFAVGMGLLE